MSIHLPSSLRWFLRHSANPGYQQASFAPTVSFAFSFFVSVPWASLPLTWDTLYSSSLPRVNPKQTVAVSPELMCITDGSRERWKGSWKEKHGKLVSENRDQGKHLPASITVTEGVSPTVGKHGGTFLVQCLAQYLSITLKYPQICSLSTQEAIEEKTWFLHLVLHR